MEWVAGFNGLLSFRRLAVKVNEIMRRIVHTIRIEDTLDIASKHLANENISLLPVVDREPVEEYHLTKEALENIGFLPLIEEDVLVGVITTRDIVVRAIANGKDPRTTPVAEIMTTDFACCNENDDIADALSMMERRKVRRLFALDSQKRVAGIVSRHDIFAARNGISSSDLADTDS